MDTFDRFILQIGKENLQKLNNSHVAVFGVGGVGGNVLEALIRSGVGCVTIIDADIVDKTNINRQIIALNSTVGKDKVAVAKNRALDINPNTKIFEYKLKFPDEKVKINFSKFDYVVDAVDDVKAKLEIIKQAKQNDVPVISAMGAGNKFDPLQLKVTDISKSTVCPLAKKIRQELKKMQINDVKCAFSTEKPIGNFENISSNAFVPAVMGILIAREVVFDLIKMEEKW